MSAPYRCLGWTSVALAMAWVHLAQLSAAAAQAPASPPDPYLTPPPPAVSATYTQRALHLRWNPYPAAEAYRLLHATDAAASPTSGLLLTNGFSVLLPTDQSSGVYQIGVEVLDTNALLTATLLNRIAYGPTPDELDRVKAMGPEAYLNEQLAPETIQEELAHNALSPAPIDGWSFYSATGTGSSSLLYVYLEEVGEGYLDDLRFEEGTVPGAGTNLVRNGGFEAPLTTADWTVASNHLGSVITTAQKRSGASSLRLVATAGGTTASSALVQQLTPQLSSSRTYTVSFWYKPATDPAVPLTIRLSGSGVEAQSSGTLRDRLNDGVAAINDLRAWHILNAVHSRRQLLEVLTQFFDNHFVTQYSKARDYLDAFYRNDGEVGPATDFEFKELQRWRAALLNPQCTFHDLLRISAESPTMIIYLDTVDSRGSNGQIANENYARELLELFTMGVDNGYDQHDIEEMSRVWTGWSLRYVRPDQVDNRFAERSNLLKPGAPAGSTEFTNLVGVWSFVFKMNNHNTQPKYLFYEYDAAGTRQGARTIPARFGARAGQPYAMTVSGRSGTNGIHEGYEVLAHLADLPFTQEYLAVKLCRTFVHDDFKHGVYDYTAPNLSPEAALVKSCMDAWESTSPKGQIRTVLRTIFTSELFRRHGAAQQKVKTPLEFSVSALRAFLTTGPDGAPTAEVDALALRDFMRRAGNMDLFNRDDPDGFPETAPPWISAGTLAERLRFAQALLMPTSSSSRSSEVGNNRVDPLRVVQSRLPQSQWKDAAAVTDLFLGLLYPGEGRGNLAPYREIALDFLNTGDGGEPQPFASLATTGSPSPQELRLRGMVAMLLTLPRFHEQ